MVQNSDQNTQSRDQDSSQDMMVDDVGGDPPPLDPRPVQPALIQSKVS